MLQGLKSWASAFSIDLGSKSIGLSWAFSKHFKSFQKSSVGKNGSWNFERHGPWPPQYPRCPWQCQCRLVSRLEHRWRRLPSWRRSHPKTSESLPQNWRAMLGVMLQNNINKQTPWRVHEWKTCISYNIYNIYHIYIYHITKKTRLYHPHMPSGNELLVFRLSPGKDRPLDVPSLLGCWQPLFSTGLCHSEAKTLNESHTVGCVYTVHTYDM